MSRSPEDRRGQRRTDTEEAGETNPSAQARIPVSDCSLRDESAHPAPNLGARHVLVLGAPRRHPGTQAGWITTSTSSDCSIGAERNIVSIGIPTDDDPEDRPVVPAWQEPLSKFFDHRNWHAPPATYAYDFGDDWQHVLVHEEHESTLRWAGGAFDPLAFDPAAVKFDDSKKRWKKAFERRP